GIEGPGGTIRCQAVGEVRPGVFRDGDLELEDWQCGDRGGRHEGVGVPDRLARLQPRFATAVGAAADRDLVDIQVRIRLGDQRRQPLGIANLELAALQMDGPVGWAGRTRANTWGGKAGGRWRLVRAGDGGAEGDTVRS